MITGKSYTRSILINSVTQTTMIQPRKKYTSYGQKMKEYNSSDAGANGAEHRTDVNDDDDDEGVDEIGK